MMSKFIEVHEKETGDIFSVNVDHIISFGKEGIILTGVPRAYALATAESYDEINQLIHDAGVLIHKADPRLDTTTPLTMEDLKDMEGEPVWNSNTLKWMIVHRYGEGDKKSIVWLVRHDSQFELMTADDLIKTPLYRMLQR